MSTKDPEDMLKAMNDRFSGGLKRGELVLLAASLSTPISTLAAGAVLRRTEEGIAPAITLDLESVNRLHTEGKVPFVKDGPPIPKLHRKKGSTKSMRRPKSRKKRSR